MQTIVAQGETIPAERLGLFETIRRCRAMPPPCRRSLPTAATCTCASSSRAAT